MKKVGVVLFVAVVVSLILLIIGSMIGILLQPIFSVSMSTIGVLYIIGIAGIISAVIMLFTKNRK